jgi:tubulin---tyrosine ligase
LTEYQNRKFHLRVYVLAVGSLQVYVYEDILALFSLETYSDCSSFEMDIINMKSHITNTCVQLDSVESNEKRLEIENECVKKFWNLKLNDLNEKENSLKLNSIFSQIKQCVGELFECLYFEPTVFQPLNNAFELYGFDFLLDQNYNCYFLEANSYPDFKQTGYQLNDLISCLFYQTVALTCDSFFNVSNVCEPNKMHLVLNKIKK